jgi:hypothetical protein
VLIPLIRSILSTPLKLVGAITVSAVGLTASGVALASTPSGPSAKTPLRVFIASHDAAIFVPFRSPTTLGRLALPAGNYIVTAKAWMQNQARRGNSAVRCKLTLGSKFDQSQSDAQDGNASTGPEPVRNGVMNLTLTIGIRNANTARLSCQNLGGGSTSLRFIRITAIKVGTITKSAFL